MDLVNNIYAKGYYDLWANGSFCYKQLLAWSWLTRCMVQVVLTIFYRKCGTHAQIFSQILAYGKRKNKIKRSNSGRNAEKSEYGILDNPKFYSRISKILDNQTFIQEYLEFLLILDFPLN